MALGPASGLPYTEPMDDGGEAARSRAVSPDSGRSAADAQRWVGQTLASRYRVERLLGSGGFADVFAASVLDSDQHVAVKLLHADVAKSEDAAVRFRQEAQFISLIAHPNIVSVQDFGTLDDGTPYMIMELLEGEPLGSALERQVIPPALAFRIAMEACEGLAAAHERGVIHRDVKPDNLFLERAPNASLQRVKILDLGVAKMVGGTVTARVLTQRGTLCGTPEYMAPEQVAGKPVGPGADVYALTCVLWAMLLGAPPFKDVSVVEVLGRHALATPEWPEDLARTLGVPEETQAVLLHGLAKDPNARPGSMLELQNEIAGLLRRVRQASRLPVPSVSVTSPTQRLSAAPAADTLPALPADPPCESRLSAAHPERAVVARPPQTFGGLRPSKPVRGAPAPPPSAAPLRRVRLEAGHGTSDELGVVLPDVYWVGQRHGVTLECNPYLRVFTGRERESAMLIGPGPESDLDLVLSKVRAVIGSLDRLGFVFVHHEAPDNAAGIVRLAATCPHAKVLCSRDAWRLLRYYGVAPDRVTVVDESTPIDVGTGHPLHVVPSPFCPSRGAVMLYDASARVLFSGGLFSGIRQPSLVTTTAGWEGIEILHQTYMPTRGALQLAVRNVRRLTPQPLVIAPQHGAAIVGNDIIPLLKRIEQLRVGLDLLGSA